MHQFQSCRNVPERICDGALSPALSLETNCKPKVTGQDCKVVNQEVAKEVCSNVPREECRNEPSEVCRPVAKNQCQQVPVRKQFQECSTQPT